MELRVTRNGHTYLVRWTYARICDNIRIYRIKPYGLFRKQLLVTYLAPILEALYDQQHPNEDQNDNYLVRLGEFAVDYYLCTEQQQQETNFRMRRQQDYLARINAGRQEIIVQDAIIDIPDLNEEDLLQKAYERYKLFWMMTHDKTVHDLANSLLDYAQESLPAENADFKRILSDWEMDVGFNGELWPCLDEFKQTEYKDRATMSALLMPNELAAWDRRICV